jgi:hypothetical protein
MSIDAHDSPSGLSPAQQQAVWPWLLLPLIALALFFALRSVKQAPAHVAHGPETAAESLSNEASASP